jgi:NADPH2:quinone reductase
MNATSETMLAWQAPRYGPFKDVLRLGPCAPTEPDRNRIVIRVRAIGLNYLDILSIAGKYQEKGPLPFIPGAEAAGTVVADSPDSPFQVGDNVMTVGTAACAEYMAATPETTFAMPENMSFEEAAAFQLVYQTAHMALVHRARLRPDAFLLVHAGAGGVGTAAIQIGRLLGARVIATAGSDEKLKVCLNAGAETAINYRQENVVEIIRDITSGRGVDVVFDPVGGSIFEASTRCVAFEGRILVIGFASGQIPSIAVNRILLKNMDVIGLFWGNYRQFNPQRIKRTQSDLYRLWSDGKIKPVIYRKFAFENLPQALAELAERKSYGKIVVNGPGRDA